MPAATNLKTSTEAAHRRAESALNAAAIRRGDYNKSAYLRLMQANYGTWSAVAAWLGQYPEELLDEDDLIFVENMRAGIIADLEKLENSDARFPKKFKNLPIKAYHPATALGLLYVLRGSTLGGAMLARMFPQSPELADLDAFRFYRACGQQPPGHWKTFQQRLNEELTEPEDLKTAISAAELAFDHLYDGMLADPPANKRTGPAFNH